VRILVTGAAGFIGSSVSAKLAQEGNEVIGIDSFTNYYSTELKNLRVSEFLSQFGIECHSGDLTDYKYVQTLVRNFKPDSIINLAAQAGVRIPLKGLNKYVESNLIGFTNIARVAVEEETPSFLYASSSSVYGDSAKLPYVETEKHLIPNSFYGASKLFNELAIPSLIRGSQTRARGLRFFTVYGPWGRPDMAYFRMIANILTGVKFEFFGDGKIERDFTYIEDVSEMVLALNTQLTKSSAGEYDVVNVGGGSPMSMNKLEELLNQITGKRLESVRLPQRQEDVLKTMADPAYLLSLINVKPETDLEVGITKTIDWAGGPRIQKNLMEWVESSL
jgi:UDP-glucuronate 4-epimerase